MTKEIASAERMFLKARKDFVSLASQTSRALTREAKRLGRDLKRANARVAKLRVQQMKRAERMATAARSEMARTVSGASSRGGWLANQPTTMRPSRNAPSSSSTIMGRSRHERAPGRSGPRLGGSVPVGDLDALFPALEPGAIPAVVLHNAPGRFRPITDAIAALLDGAGESLDVVNPYVCDRGMIRRIEQAARRGVAVRLFVPANANNWACAAAQQHHHPALLDAGVRILEYPTMLHAKAFVRDGEELLAGTCNLEAWSLKRFFEIDLRLRSAAVATQFDERFSAPAEAVSTPGHALAGVKERARGRLLATLSPLL